MLTKYINIAFFITLLLNEVASSANTYQNTETDSLKAIELFRTAIDYARNAEAEKALSFFNQSLKFRKKVFGEKHYRLGSTYSGMAIQYKNLYQMDNALKFYKLAEEMYLFNAPKNDARLGDVYTNLGVYFRNLGNFAEAIRYNERAKVIYENSKDEVDLVNFNSVIYNLAESYHLANRENDALMLIRNFNPKAIGEQKIQFLNLEASIYTSLREFERAKKLYKNIFSMLDADKNLSANNLANQLVNYAQFFSAFQLPDSALKYLIKAEPQFLNNGSTLSDIAELYRSIGDAYSSISIKSSTQTEFEKIKAVYLTRAIEYYAKSLNFLTDNKQLKELSKIDFEKSNFPVAVLQVLQDLGKAHQQMAQILSDERREQKITHLEKAVWNFDTASDLVKFIRVGFISDESKILFSELQFSVYSSAIEAAYLLFQLTGKPQYFEIAYKNTERSKAASLFDKTIETEARKISFIPDSLIQLEARYNSNLTYYREKLFNELHATIPDPDKVAEFEANIFSNEQNRNDFRLFLEKNYNKYYQLKYSKDQPYLSTIQKKLKRNEVLLEYTCTIKNPETGSGYIYMYAITKNNFRLIRKPLNENTTDQIISIYKFLSSSKFYNTGKKEFNQYTASAHEIYTLIVQPFEDLLSDKRLIIIPDGLLSYLPFEALLTSHQISKTIHFHDLPYLIHKNPISYAYSTDMFFTEKTDNASTTNRILAFAPSYFNLKTTEGENFQLAEIKGAKEEVNYLANKFKTVSFTDEHATEKNFRKMASDFEVLHLAMHMLINDSLPMYSRLAFYPGNNHSLANDGWVTTADIYNLNLKSKMTVLSACNTGGGTLRKGEGIMSLARGFFYAGCPSVIMTLWEVEDRSGAEIMKDFYRNLKYGKSKDVALRNAKLKYIEHSDPLTAHPHFWLSYIGIGNPDPLYYGYEVYLFGAIVLILAILIFDILKKKAARKKRADGE